MIPFKNKKYKCIIADPPWKTPNSGCMRLNKFGVQSSKLEEKYPLMSLEEIQNLPVSDLAADSCGLFLWVTQTVLQEGLQVMTKWGFKYHITITWDKGGGYSLWGFCRDTELCLFGYKGKLENIVNLKGKYMRTIIHEKPGKHSEKPKRFYTMIEGGMKPPYIELFSRMQREGWESWGNEVPKFEQRVLSNLNKQFHEERE